MSIKVKAFKDGSVMRQSVSRPDFSSIMVVDDSVRLNGGFIQKNNSPAFIFGKTEDIQKMNLKDNMDISSVFGPQRIVIKEQTTPFFEGQNPKINPDSGAIIMHKGQPVYRTTELVSESSNVHDELLPADVTNTEATSTYKKSAIQEELKN